MADPSPSLTLYISSVSSSLGIKKQQQRIHSVLSSLGMEYVTVDISSSVESRARMRELVGSELALPPQLCNGDKYCGDFEAFEEAVECKELNSFLKLE